MHFKLLLMWKSLSLHLSSFRWVKDGEGFFSERKGSGTLRVKDEQSLELYHGIYRCYASNPLGTAMTQTVKVTVECESQIHKNGNHKYKNTI